MVMPLTLHMEEGTCRVLTSAAPCPALIVPRISRLDSTKTQHPALNHCLWWQRACRDMVCHHPTVSHCSVLVSSHPHQAPTEPLKGGLGAASDHAAELGRLPRCHAQLHWLHGGGGSAGGAGCGETQGGCLGLTRPPGAVPRRWEAGWRAQPAAGCTWSPSMQWVAGTIWNPPLVTYLVCAPP